jgi:hypothetical protein
MIMCSIGSLPTCVSSETSAWSAWLWASHFCSAGLLQWYIVHAPHWLKNCYICGKHRITQHASPQTSHHIPAQFSHALPNLLPMSPPLPAIMNDSVYALSCLVQSGNHDAFILLLQFCVLVQSCTDPIIHLVSHIRKTGICHFCL